VPPASLWEQLGETELPKLWVPKRDDLIQIAEIPTLGTGKVDLRKLKQMASEEVERAEG
jgi:acyl-[acyl-carrier-protein]-phospholipid O-acyltransferase/long-chain-fatty-acid--[acyl-carrier-protein] ligase